MSKQWRILTPTNSPPLEAFPHLHPMVAQLFANRGLNTTLQVEEFLNPDWESGIHDPYLFTHMREAVARVYAALRQGERITVHGDYDADGVTGSALVISVLREIEANIRQYLPSSIFSFPSSSLIDFYIPHRDKEGYGLHRDTVRLLKERGTQLLITVDCGIACVKEIAAAKELGMDTVVLDHHEFGSELPGGLLIHPRLPGEAYPFGHLAAVGVAWKFSCALMAEARSRGLDIAPGWEKWLLDLVSIATVTDMVPLIGENRVLMKYGLIVLNKTRRPGLRKLVEAAGKTLGDLDSEAIGYALGPRINAAGRMDHAELALGLILAETDEEAERLATQLEEQNKRRQKVTEAMMAEALRMTGEGFASSPQAGSRQGALTVLWNADWSPALVGLVAGRYLERTGKPCVAVGKHGEAWIGSGRSPNAYDITAAMHRAGEGLLTRVGGHPQACGFSFAQDEQALLLAERLIADAEERLKDAALAPEILVDAALDLEAVDWRLIETLKLFEPYGIGNPRPLFMSSGLEIVEIGLVGKDGAHLRCTLRSEKGSAKKFIGFRLGKRADEMGVGKRVDVVYDVGVNEWNGRRDIQCRLVDVRQAE